MVWRSPSELVTRGFAAARIVMMNEGHDGLRRCARTRRTGREILPAAHAAGCRTLALEALENTGTQRGPTTVVRSPPRAGYLEQPEMWALVDAALALGWQLVAYECQVAFAPADLLADAMGAAFTQWREEEQASNLVAAAAEVERLLVWCGNGHHGKRAYPDWTPMGVHVAARLSLSTTFSIDQLATVALAPGHKRPYVVTPELSATLERYGGTAGFLTSETPPGMRIIDNYDAVILSTDNEVS